MVCITALKYMHDRRVMHRDLKPANVFLTLDGTVKVGDLGLGRAFSEATMKAFSKVGTPLYMSPEVLKGKGYEWKSDIWSLGYVSALQSRTHKTHSALTGHYWTQVRAV